MKEPMPQPAPASIEVRKDGKVLFAIDLTLDVAEADFRRVMDKFINYAVARLDLKP